jgi:hypothetical protein
MGFYNTLRLVKLDKAKMQDLLFYGDQKLKIDYILIIISNLAYNLLFIINEYLYILRVLIEN